MQRSRPRSGADDRGNFYEKKQDGSPAFCKRLGASPRSSWAKSAAFSDSLFPDGNPDFGVVFFVLGAFFVFGRIVVVFHAVAGGEFQILHRREPLGVDARVDALQRRGERAGAGEDRPGEGRNGAHLKALGRNRRGVAGVGDEVIEGLVFPLPAAKCSCQN